MEKGRKGLLKQVPMRKLLASVKRDIRQTIRASAVAAKAKKK